MNMKNQSSKHLNTLNPNNFEFEQKIIEKINRNFLNDDFLNKLVDINCHDERKNKSTSLFDRFLGLSRECYIQGIMVGMNIASEIYEERGE